MKNFRRDRRPSTHSHLPDRWRATPTAQPVKSAHRDAGPFSVQSTVGRRFLPVPFAAEDVITTAVAIGLQVLSLVTAVLFEGL